MNSKNVLIGTATMLLSCSSAWAQDSGEEAEATIRLMGAAEAELPDAVTKTISLPGSMTEDETAVANATAVEKSAQGIATANENRLRREEGLTRADEAREQGADMANEAMENREARGRSEDLPERPDTPQPPTPPGPPGGL
jgi:hypothetical protein